MSFKIEKLFELKLHSIILEGSRRFEEVVDDPDDPNEITDGAEEAELYAIQVGLVP